MSIGGGQSLQNQKNSCQQDQRVAVAELSVLLSASVCVASGGKSKAN
jgi:hypothetical protein